MNTLLALLRLELLRQVRQPLPLLMLLLLGLVGAPLTAVQAVAWSESDEPASLLNDALSESLPIAADPTFAAWVVDDDGLVVREGVVDQDGELDDDEVWVDVAIEGRTAWLEVGPTSAKTRKAESRIGKVLARQTAAARREALVDVGLDPDALTWDVQIESHEATQAAGSPLLAFGIPLLLTMLLTTATMYAAFDAVLSEKLHHTAEALLTTRASRTQIAVAKSINVLGMAMVVGTSLVVGLQGVAWLGWLDPVGQQLTLPVSLAAWLLALAIAMQLSGWSVTAAAWCDDYQTAGLIAVPMLLVPPGLASLALLPGAELTWWTGVLPVANVVLVFRDLLLGEPRAVAVLGVAVATAGHIAIAWRVAAGLLADPTTITGRATPEGRRALGRFGPDAFITFASAMVFSWFIGSIATQAALELGLLVSQLGYAAIGVGGAAFFGMPWARLRLGRPALRDAALAVAIGLCTPWLLVALFTAQEGLLPGGADWAEQFTAAVQLEDAGVVRSLLLFALLPALCEELLFRGSLLGMLDRDVGPRARVVLVALLFGLMHLSVYRLLPTALLGLFAGAIAVRSRSLWPAVLLHLTHNAAVMFAVPPLGERLGLERQPVLYGLATVALGAALMALRATGSTPGPAPGAGEAAAGS